MADVKIPTTSHISISIPETNLGPLKIHLWEEMGNIRSEIGLTTELSREGVEALRDRCNQWLGVPPTIADYKAGDKVMLRYKDKAVEFEVETVDTGVDGIKSVKFRPVSS